MRWVLIVDKIQDADVKPTELSQIAGGGIANKSLDKERPSGIRAKYQHEWGLLRSVSMPGSLNGCPLGAASLRRRDNGSADLGRYLALTLLKARTFDSTLAAQSKGCCCGLLSWPFT